MSERPSLDGVPAAEMPRAGKLSLRFPKELESEYRTSRSESNRRWARMSLYVALSTTLGFSYSSVVRGGACHQRGAGRRLLVRGGDGIHSAAHRDVCAVRPSVRQSHRRA